MSRSILRNQNKLCAAVAISIAFLGIMAIQPTTHEPTSKDALEYQAYRIRTEVAYIFGPQAQLPQGDFTQLAAKLGVFAPSKPELLVYKSELNAWDKDAMQRIRGDGTNVFNEFGGHIQLIGRGDTVQIIYKNVPEGICPTGVSCL